MFFRISLTWAAIMWFSAFTAAAADPAPASAKRGPQAEEFYRLNGEMNKLLAEMAALQAKYRTADEEKQATIRLQWAELSERGNKLEPKWIASAEKAYREAPNADPQITDLLLTLMEQKVKGDDFEPAAEIGKLLMENKCDDKHVPFYAGLAAFATNDFDAADKYLNLAEKQGYFQSAKPDDELAQKGNMFRQLIGYYKTAWAKEKSLRVAEAKADDLPHVLLKTNKGDIEIELFENQAPNTVANFISLVNKGFYKDAPFHRVLAGFMAQGGDPTGTGTGGPGYNIACECYRPDHRLHFRGVLSMAHGAARDTGGSQFFLNFVPTRHLDGLHTVFGRVVKGMDVLAKIQRRDPDKDQEPARPDKIIEAKVIRARDHAYKPQKMPE
jgi:cyclophilin family peptidyl-prolyl cis-trans isomerase